MKLHKFKVVYSLEFTGISTVLENSSITLTEVSIRETIESMVKALEELYSMGQESVKGKITIKKEELPSDQ